MSRAARLIRIFTPSFADEAGSNAQNLTVKEVVARLDPKRFHVTLFYENQPDPRISERSNTRLWRWRAHGNTLISLLRLGVDVPDVYFFPREGPLDEKFLAWHSRLRWRTGIVTYIVSGGLDTLGPRPGQLRNLRHANAVFGNCRYLTELVTKLGFPAETIYDGVDRRYFKPLDANDSREPRTLTALFAGSFRKYKRADIVVRLAARWPEIAFRLAGKGEEEESCRRLARELNCTNVHFLGHLGQAELGTEMRWADLFVFPSQLEGHPQVLLQAAASGLPCVAMNSYHPDAVVDGETGFLAESEEDFARKFDRLIQDAELRKTMSMAAQRHAEQFDWERIALQWSDVFERVTRPRA